MLPDFSYETKYWSQGYTVIGIDEVGRGCLAGPITLGAYIIPPLREDDQSEILKYRVNDSKKLTASGREKLYSILTTRRNSSYTFSSDVACINSLGIMGAWRKAVVSLFSQIRKDYPDTLFTLLVDGPQVHEIPYTEEVQMVPIVKGDSKSIAIAAASIVAKVTRDRYMSRLSSVHPEYLWEKNKGYGTEAHCTAIRHHGLTPWHRTLFVRSLVGL